MKFKTMKWKWVETLEEPSVKHVITREMLNASTLYGQITVRLHSKQVSSCVHTHTAHILLINQP